MDKLDFIDGPEGSNETVQAIEPPAVEAPAEAAETPRERDEHGRFKAKEAEAAPVAEAVTPTPEPQPQAVEPEPKAAVPPGLVPVDVVQALREEIKALKGQQPQMPTPQALPAMPDPLEDPEGFGQWQTTMRLNDKLELSEEITRNALGDELVDQARDWAVQQFPSNPAFHAEVLKQRNPWGYAVKQFQKHNSLSQLGDDPEQIKEFLAWKQAQSAIAAQPAQPAPVATPTPSIAAQPSAGGLQQVASGPGAAFDGAIP